MSEREKPRPRPDDHVTPEERAAVLAEYAAEQRSAVSGGRKRRRRGRPSARSTPLWPRLVIWLLRKPATSRWRIVAASIGGPALLVGGVLWATAPQRAAAAASRHAAAARTLDLRGNYSGADAEYRAAIRLAPTSVRYRREFADMLWSSGRWRSAAAAYRDLLRLDSAAPVAMLAAYHDRLGGSLHRMFLLAPGALDAAEPELREAVRLQPGSGGYRHDLGEALYWNHKYGEAETAYREAIRIDPQEAQYTWDLGNALLHQRRYPETEAAYRSAIRLDPEDGIYPWLLGDFLADRKDYPGAEQEYREALRILGPRGRVYFSLANVLLMRGRWKDAMAAAHLGVAATHRGETVSRRDRMTLGLLGVSLP